MRIDAIASFQKLVETGSYAAAAEALFMSPTTLQSHIKSVENELGTPIVRFASRKTGTNACRHIIPRVC